MTQLHARCGSTRKQLLQVSGGSHNDTWATTGLVKLLAMEKFIKFIQSIFISPGTTKD